MENAQPSNQAALEFLQRYRPEGPWLLTAINPDPPDNGSLSDKVRSKLLAADRPELLTQWLENWNGKWNLYFHVNPTLDGVAKKAERTDIKSLDWLHVDVDPRAGEDIEEERERALRILRNPPGNVPPPTLIIFSGGGYQGFWKLKEPLNIGGDLEKAENAKLFNLALERALGGDNCHNIDRIMRLPGTVNVPNKVKLKKGRTRVTAELVEFNDNDYALDSFQKAEPKKRKVGATAPAELQLEDIVAEVQPQDLEALKEKYPKVPIKAWVMVAMGYDPDDGPAPESRSENLFYVCCELVRNEVPDEVIFSLLMDPGYEISSSILDKSKPEDYALRQLNRAKDDAVDPNLRELNDEYALIGDLDGHCRIVHERLDLTTQRHHLVIQRREDFTAYYNNRTVPLEVMDAKGNIKIIEKPLGDWWMRHPQRRSYRTLVFAPNKVVPEAYNLWQGYGCDNKPGDAEPFLTHVRENICSGNEEHYKYLIGWMARAVQFPDRPGQVAVVLQGERGAGKSVFVTEFGRLFGRHFIQVADAKRLTGNFNSHLRDAVVVFSDEALYAGDKRHEGVLKTLITEDYLAVEAKGREMITTANCVHLLMASNSDWAVPAGAMERRYLVLRVSSARLQDSDYFRALKEHQNAGGREALLNYLTNYDLSEYNVRDVPKTEALQQQKQESMDDMERWWFEQLESGVQYYEGERWEEKLDFSRLVADFAQYRIRWKLNNTQIASPLKVSKFLRKLHPSISTSYQYADVYNENGMPVKKKKVTMYAMPSLEQARKDWDRARGGETNWPEIMEPPEEADSVVSDIPF